MKINPLGDRVIIKPDIQDEKKGSLYIPEVAKERPTFGEVIEVGPGKFESGMFIIPKVQVGNRVIFGKYSGLEVEVDEVQCLVMRESDIIGVVT
jgi:chaperonin GroES